MAITYRKYIVTHTVESERCPTATYSNAFMIPNHYNHSMASFDWMFDEARKSFPDLRREDVECRTVVKSDWCKHHPLIRFHLPAGTVAEGWTSVSERLPDVHHS